MTALNADVQKLIKMIVTETVKDHDSTVTIRVDSDGALSISVYPIMGEDEQ